MVSNFSNAETTEEDDALNLNFLDDLPGRRRSLLSTLLNGLLNRLLIRKEGGGLNGRSDSESGNEEGGEHLERRESCKVSVKRREEKRGRESERF
jgi:hypothetical protein